MKTCFTICMIIGVVLPLLALFFGEILEGIFDGLHFLDGLDGGFDLSLDLGGIDICFLPISMQSICAGLLFFGATGLLTMNHLTGWVLIAIAVGTGYVAAIVVQTMIRRLKKVENTTDDKEALVMYTGKVIHTIPAGSFGTVSVTSANHITTSYPARAKKGEAMIRQGTLVSILEFDGKIAIVEPKDSLEKKYEELTVENTEAQEDTEREVNK